MRIVSILLKVVAGACVLVLLLLLFIRSPWGQNLIKDRLISYLTHQTETTITLDRIYITFSGDLAIENLYIEDQNQDTLLYSRTFTADVPLWPILTDQLIDVQNVTWKNAVINVYREESQDFNYQFLIDAFMTSDPGEEVPVDTSATAYELTVGTILLQDIVAKYDDKEGGVDLKAQLGNLSVRMDESDLENMRFGIEHAALENSRMSYVQTKPFPVQEDTTATAMPILTIHDTRINNVNAMYHSVPDGLMASVFVNHFLLEAPLADLSTNQIQITNIELAESSFDLNVTSSVQDTTVVDPDLSPSSPLWPDWNIEIDRLRVSDNQISYVVDDAAPEYGKFDPNAIDLIGFTLIGDGVFLRDQTTGGQLSALSFEEASGISVDQIRFDWGINDRQILITDVSIEALNSHLQGEIRANYPTLQALMDQPELVQFDLDLAQYNLDLNQIDRFQPDLMSNPYVQTLAENPIRGTGWIAGSLDEIQIEEVTINWGNRTSIFGMGTIRNPMDPPLMEVNFPNVLFRTERQELNKFLHEDSLGIRYPDQVRLTADFSGDLDDMTTDILLETDLGRVVVDGQFALSDTLAFQSNIQVVNLRLDSMMQTPALGTLSVTASGQGRGQNMNSMNADFKATIDEFDWNDYAIRDLTIAAHLNNGQGTFESSYHDPNLHFEMTGDVDLDSISPEITANLHVIEGDLKELSIMEDDFKVAFKLNAWFKGNAAEFEAEVALDEGYVIADENSISLDRMYLEALVTPDSTSGIFSSRMMDLSLESNTSPTGLINSIQHQVQSHLSDSLTMESQKDSLVFVNLEAFVRQDPFLSEILLPGLQEMDSIQIFLRFDEAEHHLEAMVDAPHIVYSGVELDSLFLLARSVPDLFTFDLGLQRLATGPITINRTVLTNRIEDQVLYTHFLAQHQDKELLQFQTETTQVGDSIRIYFDPTLMVFDAKSWVIPQNNQIMVGTSKIQFENVNLTRGNQFFSIDDNPGDTDLSVRFEHFKLGNLISYFNPDTLLATGILNGQVRVEEPLGDAGLVADLRIDSFRVLDVDMGRLELNGLTEDAKNYEADLVLQGGEVDLELTGEYHAIEDDAEIALDLRIDTIKMTAVEYFSAGALKNSVGYITGRAEARGLMSDLSYDGQIHFNQAETTPVLLNTSFSLGTQAIEFNNEGIVFQNFTVSDAEENQFVVDGNINTSNLYNPAFDLTMQANDFQILDATEEDNSLYYGTARFDAQATITGDLNLPVMDLEISVGEGTNVTYIMPQGLANIQSREGIVHFVNKENPLETELEEEEAQSFEIQGYEINALIDLGNAATFRVVISEATGDHFQISGDGDLSFNIDQSGQMSLTGLYTLEAGHYEMNLYNLVNRRFDIARGSTVSWSGDPFDANIDVRAIYRIETSPAPLMAGQTSGEDIAVQNQYRRRLPFLVFLNVDGQLTEPELTFDLDMPEDAQGMMGGQVYGQIQRINQHEQEVNKHVFSLLVLNRFYPTSGNDGSSGGIVSVARDNLNQALSDQLNIFSDRLLGDTGFELNFGLDSYTDYDGQAPETRTELDIAAQKNFLNNRLIVNVGSEINIEGSNTDPQKENPLIGNVSVEYLITENGQLRIRGFRKNVYENVIDGQTIISGLALIFTREFNKFHELWLPIINEEAGENGSESQEK